MTPTGTPTSPRASHPTRNPDSPLLPASQRLRSTIPMPDTDLTLRVIQLERLCALLTLLTVASIVLHYI